MDDLLVLQKALAPKLDELPPPSAHLTAWLELIWQFPVQWKKLCRIYHTPKSTRDDMKQSQTETIVVPCTHACCQCETKFATARALASHRRIKHGVRTVFRQHIDGSGKCPGCRVNFHTRLKVLEHLGDVRRHQKCRDATQSLPALPEEEVARLDGLDRTARNDARRAGHTHPLAKRRPIKPTGPHD